MGEKDDGLGLSLSLGCPENVSHNPPPPVPPQAQSQRPAAAAAPFPLNLFRTTLPSFMQQEQQQQHVCPSKLATLLQQPSAAAGGGGGSSDRGNGDGRLLLRPGIIDMNRAVTVIDCDEEVMVSSPNSTVSSSLSGKRSAGERELDNDGERGASSSLVIEDDGGDADARKKLRLSKEQAVVLEETFKEHNTLNPKQKMALANQLNLRPRQVEVWFQNRRARTKLKQTEVDCEYLRRCCENLTEENRRLQKEVTELRALKLSPQFYMNMSPPTTLTMCPQCERVVVSSSSSAATTTSSTTGAAAGISRQTAHQHQRPTALTSWAGIVPPQLLGGGPRS